jgi:hypothetical protein
MAVPCGGGFPHPEVTADGLRIGYSAQGAAKSYYFRAFSIAGISVPFRFRAVIGPTSL